MENDKSEAKDCLWQAKVRQAAHANAKRSPEDVFHVGDKVLLSTKNCRNEYKKKGEKRVAKFFPRYDGPFTVVKSFPETSNYELDVTGKGKMHNRFHSSQL
jgi:hypothetical protein